MSGLPHRLSASLRHKNALRIGMPLIALLATLVIVYGPLSDPPPETRVAAYLEATARGDEGGALAIWHPWPRSAPGSEARRSELTRDLAATRAGQRYSIRTIEWWRTCCEPGIIDDPSNAGRARIFVHADDREGRDHELVFEVFVKDGTWWGDAGGQTRRDWTLRDVYRKGPGAPYGRPTSPLTEEAAIRSVHSLARIEPGTRMEAKRVRLGDLKREVGAADFTPGADPDRTVWMIAAIGQVARGMSAAPSPWAVFALDVDDHIPLGIDFGESGARPPYFDRVPAAGP